MVRTLLPSCSMGRDRSGGNPESASASFVQLTSRPCRFRMWSAPCVQSILFHQVIVLHCTTNEGSAALGNKLGNKQPSTKPHQLLLSGQTHERGTPSQHQAALTGHIFVG